MKDRYILTVRYGTSKGDETYGYTTCSVRLDGKRVGFCLGGGYDMGGTSFAQWVSSEFQEQLKTLDPKDFYGMSVYNDKIHLDGACGMSSIQDIVNAMGYDKKTLVYQKHGDEQVWEIARKDKVLV